MSAMEKPNVRALFLGVAFALCACGIAPAATSETPAIIAQAATPNPSPKPTPENYFTYSGYVRAYYFTRMNSPNATKTPNQATYNNAFSAHAGYVLGNWSIAGTYLYADPFNNCGSPSQQFGLPCAKHPFPFNGTNPDNTVPGFRLNTLYEAYLQYKDPSFYARVGDQVLNTPWAPSSDSRLKPSSYRAADVSYQIDKQWSIEATVATKFQDRVSSDFENSTLLTQNGAYADAPGVSNTGIPKGGVATNNGFWYGTAGYTEGPITGNLYVYSFDQIANEFWADAKYSWKAYGKPFIALQGGTEQSAGAKLVGKISSQVFGIQGGYTPWAGVDLTVGADFIPVHQDTITLPLTATCSSKDMISGTLLYFLPSGGTPNCKTSAPGVPGATATIYYGGWASPYSDSYATDPLFTTSMTQGPVDRRSTGSSVKVAGTFYAYKKQVRLIVSHAWYAYGTDVVGVSPTQETDIDGTYFFSRVRPGPYHGLSLRNRYGDRTQSFTGAYGGTPDFKYNRVQLEYDF